MLLQGFHGLDGLGAAPSLIGAWHNAAGQAVSIGASTITIAGKTSDSYSFDGQTITLAAWGPAGPISGTVSADGNTISWPTMGDTWTRVQQPAVPVQAPAPAANPVQVSQVMATDIQSATLGGNFLSVGDLAQYLDNSFHTLGPLTNWSAIPATINGTSQQDGPWSVTINANGTVTAKSSEGNLSWSPSGWSISPLSAADAAKYQAIIAAGYVDPQTQQAAAVAYAGTPAAAAIAPAALQPATAPQPALTAAVLTPAPASSPTPAATSPYAASQLPTVQPASSPPVQASPMMAPTVMPTPIGMQQIQATQPAPISSSLPAAPAPAPGGIVIPAGLLAALLSFLR